ncbi:MAG: nucleoside-diphosphate kinase [Armatimonadota bacterium]
MERTFIMIKPDAVKRKLIGEIISRIERRGLDIKELKMLTPSRELAEEHYSCHKGKDFFEPTVEFITSGPVCAMVVEGENAISIMRCMMGALDPLKAQSGTIRGDYTTSTRYNLIHGSDCRESAEREIKLWFG